MANFSVEHDFSLPKDQAQERIRALGEYLQNRHGIKVAWNGDRAAINGKYLVVTIDGTMTVSDRKVVLEGKDPGFLWRGKAKDYLGRKLAEYLDPTTPVAKLPRA